MPVQQSILLVDPDERTRAFLAGQLERLDVEVLTASDAEEASRLLGEKDVRVMITELYLPVKAEKCLIAETRRAQPDRNLRIVAHTHRSLTADRNWAMQAGANAYLIKPTRAARMRHVVSRLLQTPATTPASSPYRAATDRP
jgi:CheY-like chemotaxis protein